MATVLVALFLLVGSLPTPATVGHWPTLWNDLAFGDVDFYVANDDAAPFNTATADSEMGNARLTWNNVSSPPELVDYGGTKPMASAACGSSTGVPSNGWVYMKGCSISTSAMAWYTTGFTNGKEYIIRGLIGIDTSPSGFTWHISSSTSVAGTKKDLRGAAAHELGHILGSGHILFQCSDPDAMTMCPSHSLGTAKYRTAETHEVNDWKARDALQ